MLRGTTAADATCTLFLLLYRGHTASRRCASRTGEASPPAPARPVHRCLTTDRCHGARAVQYPPPPPEQPRGIGGPQRTHSHSSHIVGVWGGGVCATCVTHEATGAGGGVRCGSEAMAPGQRLRISPGRGITSPPAPCAVPLCWGCCCPPPPPGRVAVRHYTGPPHPPSYVGQGWGGVMVQGGRLHMKTVARWPCPLNAGVNIPRHVHGPGHVPCRGRSVWVGGGVCVKGGRGGSCLRCSPADGALLSTRCDGPGRSDRWRVPPTAVCAPVMRRPWHGATFCESTSVLDCVGLMHFATQPPPPPSAGDKEYLIPVNTTNDAV